MAVFRKVIEDRAQKPPLVVTIPKKAWADTWQEKPAGDVEIGLRLISEAQAMTARSEAAKKALLYHPEECDEQIETYNSALMALALARATCQPDDINAAFWPMPEDQIPMALTPAGIELLYGHLDTLTMAEAPSMPEATDGEVAALARALLDGSAWGGMTGTHAHRVKRLLKVCFDAAVTAEVTSE